MKIGIIGAGAAGLVTLKRALEYGFECQVFEQNNSVGGTWIYDERVGKDELGDAIHTSMFKNLRTNLPKVLMEFPGLKFEGTTDETYPSHAEVLDYLNKYAERYSLHSHIKFNHRVMSVTNENDKWHIRVKLRMNNNSFENYTCDAVMVCNGHNFAPNIPNIEGIENFNGTALHSHDYRVPEPFKDMRVLIIGAGTSGMELTYDIATVAKQIIFSHHCSSTLHNSFPDNVIQKPDVKRFEKRNIAVFQDESIEQVDAILYCTGFRYTYPFLSVDVGVDVLEEKCVHPLFLHLFNIKYPTMGFIGLVGRSFLFLLFDMQCRAFFKVLNNEITLPSCEDMMSMFREEMKMKENNIKKFHIIRPDSPKRFFQKLADFAKLEMLPDVVFKIYDVNSHYITNDYLNLRKIKFEIIDDENFTYELQK